MIDIKLFQEVSSLVGTSGNENDVKNYVKSYLKNSDEIIEDNFGGIFGLYKGTGKGPKVMICAHMDEIGCMVSEIREDGIIKMIALGGINPEVLVATSCYVKTNKGELIKGVIASIPPHIAKDNKITFDDLLFDIGCDSKEDVLNLGINIGSFITPCENFYLTIDNKKMVNKAWDDRLGCGVILELTKVIKSLKHESDIYLGFTVQEEVGLRGGKVSSGLIKPDLFVTVDVSPATDYLGSNNGALGKGFLIRYYDPRIIMKPTLKDYFIELASKNNLKYQLFKSMGGTDAGEAQYANNGILATTVGVPGRYIHSPQTMVSIDDIETSLEFCKKLIEDFDNNTLEKIYK